MNLYEYEGKKLFKEQGIAVPRGKAVSASKELDELLLSFESTAVKAQVLSGGRGKAGGVKLCHGLDDTKSVVDSLIGSVVNGETVDKVLVEELVAHKAEHYIGITFDTNVRAPVLMASVKGGVDIETTSNDPGTMARVPVDMTIEFSSYMARQVLFEAGFKPDIALKITVVFERLWKVFTAYGCRLVEINPLHLTNDDELLADDAKVILDDTSALWKNALELSSRKVFGREETEREIAAHKIDADDHRGVAGSVYFDLDGDIGILASGGGGLLSGMDVLLANGLKPANYTEYSGNPPAEKVKALTKAVLSKPGLRGLWLFGGTANFTDIYETLVEGFYAGLKEVQPKPEYPIVIRRGGPRDKEAFEWLREQAKKDGFDVHLFGSETPITESGKRLAELIHK